MLGVDVRWVGYGPGFGDVVRSATRRGVHIDRAACAWLVRRYIDPAATFIVVGDLVDVPADGTPFDMPGVDLSHHGTDCSFETLLFPTGPLFDGVQEFFHRQLMLDREPA